MQKRIILNGKILAFKMLQLAFNFYEMDPWMGNIYFVNMSVLNNFI